MELVLNTHNIKALSLVLPKNIHSLEEELQEWKLNEQKYELLKQSTGIKNHFVCPSDIFSSDLAIKALEKLFKENLLLKDELDALLVYSFSPDFLAPTLSSLIHKALKLHPKTLCYDNIAFCSGFLQGLMQAFLLLDNENIKKVVLICVNTKSKKIPKNDKISYFSNSDSASAVLIEKSHTQEKALFSQKIFSQCAMEETFPISCFKEGNDFIAMDRSLAFNHLSENYPTFFNDFFDKFKINKNQIDSFFFGSANHFIQKKLLELLNLQEFKNEKDESTENYGDTNINKLAFDLAAYTSQNCLNGGGINVCGMKQIFLSSFGTGIHFNAMSFKLDFGKIQSFMQIIDFKI